MDAVAAGRLWETLGVGWLRQRAGESSWTVGEDAASALCFQPTHTKDARGRWQARLRNHAPAAPTLRFCRKALHKWHFSRGN